MILGLETALVGVAVFFAIPGPARLALSIGRSNGSVWLPVVGASGSALLLLQLNLSWVLVGLLAGSGAAAARTFRRRRERRAMTRRRNQVLAACEGLAADLAAGLAPHQALLTMADQWPELRPVADAAGLGADVAAAFRAAARLPGSG